MKRVFLSAIFFLALVSARVGADEPGGENSASGKRTRSRTVSPSRRIKRLTYDFKAAGKKMEYGLFVPSSYESPAMAKTRFPLVVALHGLGSNPQQILRYPGLVRLAERHGYIVVAPMGYNTTGWYGVQGQRSRSWKPTNMGELSEQDVMNVLELTEKAYRVDPKRVCLMGHSMGGGGTLHLGMKYPGRWAALAPIAPAIYRSPRGLTAIRHTPVIVVQGARDRLVRASSTRRWIRKMQELEMTHKYVEYKDGGHIYPAFQGLPAIFEFFNTHTGRGVTPGKTTRSSARGSRAPAPPGAG
jgi:poly(3-hydroxybutyrate) depolymerase